MSNHPKAVICMTSSSSPPLCDLRTKCLNSVCYRRLKGEPNWQLTLENIMAKNVLHELQFGTCAAILYAANTCGTGDKQWYVISCNWAITPWVCNVRPESGRTTYSCLRYAGWLNLLNDWCRYGATNYGMHFIWQSPVETCCM